MTQEPASASVSVTYVVKNQDVVLNGTVSSGLLNQLTAELVGYFLFYPPLIIAERESDAVLVWRVAPSPWRSCGLKEEVLVHI